MDNFKFKTKYLLFKILTNLLFFILIFLSCFIYFSTIWVDGFYNLTSLNEILFHIFPLNCISRTLKFNFIKNCLIPTIFITISIIFLNIIINKTIVKNNNLIISIQKINITNIFKIFERNKDYIITFKIFKKYLTLKIKKFLILIILITLNIIFIFICFYSSIKILNIKPKDISANKFNSEFIESNYINPKNVVIKFPKHKQNLIYIFVESLESTFFSKKLGGNENENLLQPITKLMQDGINFSNTNKFGGAYSVFGTTFTSAGLVAQTMGIPLIMNLNSVNNKFLGKSFFKKVYALGNILKKEGYTQIFMIGSDKRFGNREFLMKNHGDYEIFDYFTAKEQKYIGKNYRKWWGFEDKKLFEIAKKKLLKLQNKKVPFNLTLLTANTHFPGGYIEENYKRKFKDPYSDAIYCSAQQINEFVSWIKKQNFYKNTTIIISGDHISMEKKHFDHINKNFKRVVFNLFINSKQKPFYTKNRIFTTLDMFPSTLASIGAEIKGERLGLGTNLFSKNKTLAEQFGIDFIDSKFKNKSKFYSNLIS